MFFSLHGFYALALDVCVSVCPGFNHSGRQGQVNFMNGLMGIANAQRTLDYIRIITEFISQPEYRDVIPLFGIVNEAVDGIIGQNEMSSLYALCALRTFWPADICPVVSSSFHGTQFLPGASDNSGTCHRLGCWSRTVHCHT